MSYVIPKAVDIANMSAKSRVEFDAIMSAGQYVVSPKFDGCAVRIEITAGGPEATSATGKPVRSIGHILDELRHLPVGYIICGEVWQRGTAFQEISGKFRSHSAQPDLILQVWDARSLTAWGYSDRMIAFANAHLRGPGAGSYVNIPVRAQAHSLAHAESLARLYVQEGGYDGVVLHYTAGGYSEGRATYEKVKIKPLIDMDLECVGFEADEGEKTGRPTVALLCRGEGGRTVRVATGLDHEQQANPEQFVGKILLIRAMGKTVGGALREPRFAGVRDDKLQPDY